MVGVRKGQARWAHSGPGEVVILDNRDSFVFNLAHRVYEVEGRAPVVVRSDEVCAEEVEAWSPRAIIVSPGPGHPRDAGCSVDVVRRLGASVPVLGVCLGHQAIAQACGAIVEPNHAPVHGRATTLRHDGRGVFKGAPERLEVARYHALSIREGSLPQELEATAWSSGLIMGVRHREWPIVGLQFHPESVLTAYGLRLLERFLSFSGT